MSEAKSEWDVAIVHKWLESRVDASRIEQGWADKKGRAHEDDYDKAAAEEWVCSTARRNQATNDQQRFGKWLKELLEKDGFDSVSVRDERRFEREVRSCIRKLIKMTKANTGFENTSRFQ